MKERKDYNELSTFGNREKWQKYWDENKTFKTNTFSNKEKFYALDMFPYPSGQGLHVGHPEGYTATDILARMKRMQGYEVMHPMGWDAFGLPAEQYAIDTGNSPKEFTEANIQTFKRQIKELGFPMIGIEKLIQQILIITNGHNGFSKSFMKMILLIWMKWL